MSDTVRVVLADDQELVRAGLRMIIEADAGLEVVGEAAEGGSAARLALQLRPDVVLMDIQMPGVDGIEATRRIVSSAPTGPRVTMLTTFSETELVYEALVAGASGFLLKDMPPRQILTAIHAVARGEELLAPALTRGIIEQFVHEMRRPAAAGVDQLTPRELEVLRLLATGLSNLEIAEQLTVGVETVKTHVSRLFDKLAVRDRVQAVILAYETGIVRPRR